MRGHGAPVGGEVQEALDPLGQELVDPREVVSEPAPDERRVGVADEFLEVLATGDRPAFALEQLGEDLEVELLVVGERAVQVERDRAERAQRSPPGCDASSNSWKSPETR